MIDVRTLLLMDNNPADAKVCREVLLTADDGAFEGEFVTTLSQGLGRLHKKGIWAISANLILGKSTCIQIDPARRRDAVAAVGLKIRGLGAI
jgi:hypothetical protein